MSPRAGACALLALILTLAFIFGCTKPAPIPDSEATSTTAQSGEETTDTAILETRYFQETETASRIDTITAFSGADPAKSIACLGRILSRERDPELRAVIVDTLAGFEEQASAQLAILAPLALSDGETEEVREAVLSALEMIDDPAAIPIWEKLTTHKDEGVAELARSRIEDLREAQLQ